MKLKGSLLPLLCLLAVSLALPTAAIGKAGAPAAEERFAIAHLAGSHGYRINIFATNEAVLVMATKGSASVNYTQLGSKLEGNRIDARLPGVGRVSLHFQERSRSRHRPADSCHGSASATREGVFLGTVKIRGEHGYTRAESHHVLGEITGEPRSKCGRGATARASSLGNEFLSATVDRGHGSSLSFSALRFPTKRLASESFFVATLSRFRGQMYISNTQVASSEDASDLEIAAPPRSAVVAPPRPFSGTAAFQQESDKEFSWTGDLAAELPGIGPVSLAGPKFDTSLCIGHRCRGDAEETKGGGTIIAVALRAAAPTPSPWRWPGSPR